MRLPTGTAGRPCGIDIAGLASWARCAAAGVLALFCLFAGQSGGRLRAPRNPATNGPTRRYGPSAPTQEPDHVISTPTSAHGLSPLRTVQVLGHGSAGSAAHVRSLAEGLVARGVRVTVCATSETEEAYDFTGAGARFVYVPPRADPASVASLRSACWDADLVHAHGLRAGLRASMALRGLRGPRGGRRVPLVITWHTKAHIEGARAGVVHLMERRVARAAAVVLGACSDLVDRARERGARDARLAPVAIPCPRSGGAPAEPESQDRMRHKERAELGAMDRPLLLAVGRLDPSQGHDLLLDAAHAWCALDPQPLVAIAGRASSGPRFSGGSTSSSCPSNCSAVATMCRNSSPPPIWWCCPAGGRPAR